MAAIANYVSVTISIQDLSPSIPNFGTILYVGASAIDQANVYSFEASPDGLAAYVTAGGALTDPFYKALSAIAGMTPHVPEVKFFSRGVAATTDTYTLTPIGVVAGKIFRLLVNGTEVSYTADVGDADTDVAAALDTLIEAVAGAASAVAGAVITVTPEGQEDVYLDQVDPAAFELQITTADSGVDTDIAAAAALDPDFYGILIDSTGDTDIADAAAYAQANGKLFLGQTFDQETLEGAGVLATLNTAGYTRTGLIVASDFDTPPNAALMGRQFALPPGASAFGKKPLPGVSADSVSATIYNAVDALNGIMYTTTLGAAFTSHGKAVSGRQLHVTRNIDWLKARIEQNILTEFINSEIIEMSDVGIAQMEKALRATLSEAETAGVILPGWTVTVPTKASLSTADVNAGIMRGLKFQAEAAKAAEKTIITGSIS